MVRSSTSLKSLLLAVVALLVGTPAARAAETLSVLGIEAEDASNEGLATALTNALRKEISSTDGYKVVPGRDLVEVKLIFSCPDESPSCMVQAATSLNASQIVFGTIGGVSGEAVVTLKLLDAKKGRIVSFLTEPLAANQRTASALAAPAKKWFAQLTGRVLVGTVSIRSTVVGATIAVDGVPSGVTTDGAVDVPNVAPGEHTVAVTKRGFSNYQTSVTVQAGKVAEVEAELSESESATSVAPAAVARPEEMLGDKPEEHSGLTIGAWSAAGVGVVSMALAIKFGLDVQQFNKDLDPYRQFPCDAAKPSAGLCDINGDKIEVDPGLSKSERDAMERQRLAEIKQLRNDGDQATQMQYIFWGVTGAMAVTSAVLFYLAAGDEGAEGGDLASHVSVAPTVNADGAGFVGRITF